MHHHGSYKAGHASDIGHPTFYSFIRLYLCLCSCVQILLFFMWFCSLVSGYVGLRSRQPGWVAYFHVTYQHGSPLHIRVRLNSGSICQPGTHALTLQVATRLTGFLMIAAFVPCR
jgi:hypothetical protein